jgi:hypothetical protein
MHGVLNSNFHFSDCVGIIIMAAIATFLIVMNDDKYTSTSGWFKDDEEAHTKAHTIAQGKTIERVECYIDGKPNGFVARHGDKTVYGD